MPLLTLALLAACIPQEKGSPQSAPIPIRGTVVTTDGTPLKGVSILVMPKEASDTIDFSTATTRTGADGTFEVQWQTASDGNLYVGRAGFGAREIQVQNVVRGRSTVDLGRVWLHTGGRQFGRVRDETGAPVADVLVVASDVLETHRSFQRRTIRPHRSYARTDAQGIFLLESTFSRATSVVLTKEGYYRVRLPWTSMDTPLNVVLKKAPALTGRLIDEEGRGVQGIVTVAYERAPQNSVSTLKTDEGGTFATTLEYPGRYCVYSRHPDGLAQSDVLEGTAANVELVVTSGEGDVEFADIDTGGNKPSVGAGEERIPMRIRDAGGSAVAGARAASMWDYSINRNARYRVLRAGAALEGSGERSDEAGQSWLYGPAPKRPKIGAAVIHAPGFAIHILENLDWDALQEQEEPRLEVVLERESVVTGRIVDEGGAPLANAEVWVDDDLGAQTNLQLTTRPAFRETRTDATGAFRIDGLSPGDYLVRVAVDGRPEPKPVSAKVEAPGAEVTITAVVPRGHTVSGQVRMPQRRGRSLPLHFRLIPLPDLRDGRWRNRYFSTSVETMPADAAAAGEDGRFAIHGLATDYYMLEVLLPPGKRGQRTTRTSVEPLRVHGDAERTFDLDHAIPGRIEGSLRMPLAKVPTARLAVIARELGAKEALNTKLTYRIQGGSIAFVDPAGSFDLPARAGRHAVRVVDTRTALPLTQEILVEVEADRGTEVQLDVRAVELTVNLGDEADRAVVSRLECRAYPAAGAEADSELQNVDATVNSAYDAGSGIDIAPGETEVKLFVPVGRIGLFPRNNLVRLFPDERGSLGNALTAEELDVDSSSAQTTIEIDVGEPRR